MRFIDSIKCYIIQSFLSLKSIGNIHFIFWIQTADLFTFYIQEYFHMKRKKSTYYISRKNSCKTQNRIRAVREQVSAPSRRSNQIIPSVGHKGLD